MDAESVPYNNESKGQSWAIVSPDHNKSIKMFNIYECCWFEATHRQVHTERKREGLAAR